MSIERLPSEVILISRMGIRKNIMVWSAKQNVIRNIGGEVNCTLSTIFITVAVGNISGKKREGNMP